MVDTQYNTAPVVLIHGMWSTAETLDELYQAFEGKGYEVHAPSLPLHKQKSIHNEKSKAQLARTGIQDYVEYLASFIKQFDRPPILVGHSMGGLLAQLVAARMPCENVILLSSAPPAGINPWSWTSLRTFGKNLFLFPLWRKVTQLGMSNIRYGIAQTQSDAIQSDILRQATYESGTASLQIGFGSLLASSPTRVEVEKINCPILIVSGTEDRITPIKIQQQIADRFPGQAELVAINGACHWTIGGSYFPQIESSIFNWLEQNNNQQAAA